MKKIITLVLLISSFLFSKQTQAQCSLNLVSTTNVLCFGMNNGNISVSMANSSNFNLQPGNVNNTNGVFGGLTAGTYTITGTDNALCTSSTITTIYQPTVLVINSVNFTNLTCFGSNDGQIAVTATGGSGIHTFSITPLGPQTNMTGIFNNLSALTYTITVTDANNCTNTTTVSLTQPPLLVPTISSSTNPSCVPGCDGTATLTATGGTPPYTYTILPAGPLQPSSGNFTTLCDGNIYTITVSDGNSCTGATTIILSTPNSPIITVTAQTPVSCFGACDGLAQVTTIVGIVYTIAGPGTPVVNATGAASSLCAGIYTITGMDANSCSATTTVTITQPTLISFISGVVTNVSCNGGNDGVAIVAANGGIGAITYSISPNIGIQNPAGTFNGLVVSNYTITGTDANLCTATTTVVITQPPAVLNNITSSTAPSCVPGCDGTVTLTATGGTPSYTYSIVPIGPTSPSFGNFVGLCAGTNYTVTTTDANGCTATTTIILTSPPSPVIAITSSTNPTCVPGCDGSATVTPILGGVYTITPSGTINAASGWAGALCAGTTYTIVVSDVNGCTGTTTITFASPSFPVINISSSTIPSCVPGCDAVAITNASGGTPPYAYSISPNGNMNPTNGIATGLCGGMSYTVTATDNNNCLANTILFIPNPIPPSNIVSSISNPTCVGGCIGFINPSAFGGTGPYTYTISGNIFNNLCAGSYTIQATDANYCTISTIETLINNPFNPSIQAGIITSLGSITSSPSGGTPPYQFSLNGSPFSTTNSFNSLCSGTYTLTVKDNFGAGCLKDTIVTIVADTTFPGGSVTPFIVNPTCSLSTNGMISLIVTPANTYQYLWNTNDTTSFLNNIGAGNFSVNIKNPANECISVIIPVSSIGSNCGNISGTVYFDSISNCMQDISEHGIPNTMIITNPGNYITYTDANGDYSYNQLPYGTYTISHQNNINAYYTHCGNNQNFTLNALNTNQINHYGDTATVNLDYSIFLNYNSCFIVPSPVKSKQIIAYHNNPTYSSTGTVYAVFDSINHYVNSNPTHTSISGDTVFWNLTNINAWYNAAIQINFTFPTSYTSANTFPFTIGLSNLQYLDTNQLNNQINYTIPFCNSYDPNDKHVAPKGEGPNGNILASDLLLTYNINFQNTGNAPAYNIVIEDTLSDKLDITTFNVLQSSHPYQLEVVNNQIIKWKFFNIMLPDSTTNEPASHGHIHYQIRQKNGNQIGDVIKNKAYIYFDYNPPIITNETVNTIYQPTGIKNTTAVRNQVVIYPNPASTEVFIDAEKSFTQFTLYNQQMSIVNSQSFASTKSKKVDISTLSNGIYFIKTNNGEMKKLVVQR